MSLETIKVTSPALRTPMGIPRKLSLYIGRTFPTGSSSHTRAAIVHGSSFAQEPASVTSFSKGTRDGLNCLMIGEERRETVSSRSWNGVPNGSGSAGPISV